MTYREIYQECETFAEFEDRVKADIEVALFFEDDTDNLIEAIREAANEVIATKGWEDQMLWEI